MAIITISDLEQNEELDRKAMTCLYGGLNPQPNSPPYRDVSGDPFSLNRIFLSSARYRRSNRRKHKIHGKLLQYVMS